MFGREAESAASTAACAKAKESHRSSEAVLIARLEHGEGALEVGRRLLEGEVCKRPLAGLACIADRLRLIAHLRRREPEVRQLVDARLRIPAGQLLQRFADAAVQTRPARRAQFVVERSCSASQNGSPTSRAYSSALDRDVRRASPAR